MTLVSITASEPASHTALSGLSKRRVFDVSVCDVVVTVAVFERGMTIEDDFHKSVVHALEESGELFMASHVEGVFLSDAALFGCLTTNFCLQFNSLWLFRRLREV